MEHKTDSMRFLAHYDKDSGREQRLLDHLTGTAELAAGFAEAFGARDAAYRSGILHDLGKYSSAFQRRIRGAKERVDHSTAGALEAISLRDLPVALCIAGHHGGLPEMGSGKSDTSGDGSFWGRMKRRPGVELEDYSAFRREVTVPQSATPARFAADPKTAFFYVHMLYSCLVDADWLDTEAFMTGARPTTDEGLAALLEKLERHIEPWWNAETELNQKRCAILRRALDSGALERGLFSLTVPTGGGKTVSSMAFALRHALHHGMRRIIYIIPYTSIIEQTQKVFEEIFGAENVVAHYANVDFGTDEMGEVSDRRRLATENWDAPVILTTAVQFFESIFANKSSRCRKLHNIAQSVLIFDEAQMLPVLYLKPCLWAISQLTEHYGCSSVLCTATQPSLDRLFEEFLPGYPMRELCPDVEGMYTFFRRVRYENIGVLSDGKLAARLNDEEQVLCIVSTKKQAQDVFSLLDKAGSFHLSTAMTPAHRRQTLDELRRRLREGEPCRVVSTSLVEAGVDVDFPTVYRAPAGLDSLIQAGGRCNREGKRAPESSVVYLFASQTPPHAAIRQNVSAAQKVMGSFEDIASPQAIRAYFYFLYYVLGDDTRLDQKDILGRIVKETLPLASVAEQFRLIENAERTIYVPWGEGAALVQKLRECGPSRDLLRQLGQYAVGAYPTHFENLRAIGAIEQVSENAGILLNMKLYSEAMGLELGAQEGVAYMS